MRHPREMTFGPRLGLAVSGILLAAASVAMAPAQDRIVSDGFVRDAIEDEMRFDRNVPFDAIDVAVSNGVVTLDGTVPSLLARERAVNLATTVKGVRSVVDRIEVVPRVARGAEAIETDVARALNEDPATEAQELEIAVEDGGVILGGTVDSWQERALAERVVSSVKGVTRVDNQIDVEYHAVRPDEEIENEVAQALEWDILVDDGLIDVSVQNGNVKLSGVAGSVAEKNRAVRRAWVAGVTGVTGVDGSELEVERWARDDDLREHKYTLRTDAEIRRAVESALKRDPRVSAFDVSTEVDGGIVTLRGTVPYVKAKRAAGDDARNATGVVRVDNRIRVRPAARLADADIVEDVNAALARDSVVEGFQIDVAARNGTVTLNGEVDSYYEKFHADDVASRVAGVVGVDNELEVDYDEPLNAWDPYVDVYEYPYGYGWYDYRSSTPQMDAMRSDADIQESVENELWWSPFVDSEDVTVSVEEGVVTLTGTVDGWGEARAAIENAYEGGAPRVDNDLVVSSL